jgi:hypothetical protein
VPDDARPSFAVDFPRNADLDAAVDSFAQGNYARARSESARILASNADDETKRAARTLIERTQPAPLALLLLALTALLLASIGGWWIVHGKAPTTSARGTLVRSPVSSPARSTPESP